jgi:hypothetical protein
VSLRMPHLWGLAQPDPGQSLIEHELQGESAANLGRLGQAVETALAALSSSDAPKGSPERAALVKAAAGAVWRYFIQREACGMRDHRHAIAHYAIPAAVLGQIGAMD